MLVNTLLGNYVGAVNTLAAYVQQRRSDLGLTQAELAARCDLSRDFIAQVESGKSKLPQPDNRRKLALGLNVSHLDLLIAAGEITREEIAPLGVQGAVEPDPVLADLIARLRRLPLTGERPATIRSVIDVFADNDRVWRESSDRVNERGDPSNEVGFARH